MWALKTNFEYIGTPYVSAPAIMQSQMNVKMIKVHSCQMLQIFPGGTICGKSLERQKPKSEAILHLRRKLVEAKHKFSQNMNIRLTPCHL